MPSPQLKPNIKPCYYCDTTINMKTDQYIKQRNIEKSEFTTYYPHDKRDRVKTVQTSELIEPICIECATKVRRQLKANYNKLKQLEKELPRV